MVNLFSTRSVLTIIVYRHIHLANSSLIARAKLSATFLEAPCPRGAARFQYPPISFATLDDSGMVPKSHLLLLLVYISVDEDLELAVLDWNSGNTTKDAVLKLLLQYWHRHKLERLLRRWRRRALLRRGLCRWKGRTASRNTN